MEEKDSQSAPSLGRRRFLKGTALGAAAGAAATAVISSTTRGSKSDPKTGQPRVVPPTEKDAKSELLPPPEEAPVQGQPGSDYMLDVIKSLGMEYCIANPGSTFEGLHESIVNHGGNSKPELLTTLHEETGVAIAHGYAKVEGKPMMTMLHGTVGLLHGSMAIYQAWADRAPMFIVVGSNRKSLDPSYHHQHSFVSRAHSAQDMGALVRDFVKWDDDPLTLERFADAAKHAYSQSLTPPRGPCLLTVDKHIQEASIIDRAALPIPKSISPSAPQGESNSVREAAKWLVEAERPLIRVQRLARTPVGWDLMIELAELLQAPVDCPIGGSWQDFPSWHRLYGKGGPAYQPDLVLGLEANHMTEAVRDMAQNGGKTINICSEYMNHGSNIYNYGMYAGVDLAIAADGEATLPSLIEEIRKLVDKTLMRKFEERGKNIAAAHAEIRELELQEARYGWNANPISVPRMISELSQQIQNDDWAIVSGHQFTGGWQRRLLNHDKHYRYRGDCGGFGIGAETPISVGGALAHKKHGRLPIAIVGDGDFNFLGPNSLWTAAHHKIPLLTIIHNNKAYHQEIMILQRLSSRRGRGQNMAHIGTTIRDPDPDYAAIARGYGVHAEGPISDPAELAPALKRALDRVRAGEPALIDVVSQPR